MERAVVNLRYLLWREDKDRETWPGRLAVWARCDPARARTILERGDLSPEEQDNLANSVGIEPGDLRYTDLVQQDRRVDVLIENLRYLLALNESGGRRPLSEELAVSEATISRWINGSRRPKARNLNKIEQYLGLKPDVDLSREPVFLSLSPIGETKRKAWLREKIDQLDRDTLNELFPALERLLKEP